MGQRCPACPLSLDPHGTHHGQRHSGAGAGQVEGGSAHGGQEAGWAPPPSGVTGSLSPRGAVWLPTGGRPQSYVHRTPKAPESKQAAVRGGAPHLGGLHADAPGLGLERCLGEGTLSRCSAHLCQQGALPAGLGICRNGQRQCPSGSPARQCLSDCWAPACGGGSCHLSPGLRRASPPTRRSSPRTLPSAAWFLGPGGQEGMAGLLAWRGGVGGGDRHGPSLLTPPAGCARPFPLPPGPERGPLLGAVVPGRPPAPVKKGRGWACRARGSRSGHPGHVCSRPGPSVCLRHMSALSPRHLAHPLTRGTHPSICGTQIRAFILSSAVVEGGPIFQGLCPERTPAPPRKGCWTDASQACALGPWRPGRVKACSVQTVHAAQQARGPQRWGELHPQVAASTCPAEMRERGEASASVRPEPGLRAPLTAGRTLRAQPARRRGPCGQTCQQAGGSPAGGAPLCEENWGTGLALWGRHRRRPLSQAEPQSLN